MQQDEERRKVREEIGSVLKQHDNQLSLQSRDSQSLARVPSSVIHWVPLFAILYGSMSGPWQQAHRTSSPSLINNRFAPTAAYTGQLAMAPSDYSLQSVVRVNLI